MGLDMYLTGKKYVGGWVHSKDEEKMAFASIMGAVGLPDWKCTGSPHVTVEVSQIYWRKANQIHRWFVENVQEGKDDCEEYYVERADLIRLRDLCKTVLAAVKPVPGKVHTGTTYPARKSANAPLPDPVEEYKQGNVISNPAVAEELLPAASGFFFGSQDYDEYYLDDVKRTAESLDKLLGEPALEPGIFGWGFYYRASW
jgi:hypothetical protein